MSEDVDFTTLFDPDRPKATIDDLFAPDDDLDAKKRRQGRDADDEEEVVMRGAKLARVKVAQTSAATAAATAAEPSTSAIDFDIGTTTNEVARQLLRDTMEAQLVMEIDRLEGRAEQGDKAAGKKKKKKTVRLESDKPDGQAAKPKRRPIGSTKSCAERGREVRQRRKAEKEEKKKIDFSLVAKASDALRSSSPLRLLTEDKPQRPLASAGVTTPMTITEQAIPLAHCTVDAWVLVNGPRHVAAKQRELEEAVKAWMGDRDNRAWKSALQGGLSGGSFERTHPCKAANLPDATQCESFADLDNLLRTTGDYIGKIEGAFKRSVDLTSSWSGRVHSRTQSEEILMAAKCLQPSPNDAVLYHFLRHDHRGHWRAPCEHVVFDSWDTPLDKLKIDPTAAKEENYAHCTAKDISQVLRNPNLVEAMTNPTLKAGVSQQPDQVLLGFDAICREAVWGMPHDSQQWDKSSLEHDNRAWRRSPRWAPFFAALVARLSCLPLPSLVDLGNVGAWWLGTMDATESPAMRAIRRHLAHLTVARTIYDRLSHAKNGLWMKSRETMLVKELGCDQATAQIEGVMRDWLYMRYTGLATVHMLTASWLAYVFAPCCSKLDYTPLSFALRAVGSDGVLLRRYFAQKRDQRDRGHKPNVSVQNDFANDSMAIGVLMTQQHAELKARGGDMSKAAAEFAMPRDLSSGQLQKRMAADLFAQCVWSDFRANRSPFCVHDGITMEAVAIATLCRSFDRHLKPERLVVCTAGPSGTVEQGVNPTADFVNHLQPTLPPVTAYVNAQGESLVHAYVTECCKRPSTHATRVRPWLMCTADDSYKLTRKLKRTKSSTATMARACLDEFFKVYYLVNKTSPAADRDKVANFDEAIRTTIREWLRTHQAEAVKDADELERIYKDVRRSMRAIISSNVSTTYFAILKTSFL